MDKTLKCKVFKLDGNEKSFSDELLVCEYPLTILLNKKKIATLLCSPENLKFLALGFLRTEQLITTLDDVTHFNLDEKRGIAEVETKDKNIYVKKFQSKKLSIQKNEEGYENNSSEFLDSMNCEPVHSDIILTTDKIYKFMESNLNYSETFKKTGGVHSIALCDTDNVIVTCEDVARHNAMDKVIGSALINNIFLKDKIMILSGRVSLEMILKSAKLQIPIIISKSAPTSLSVKLAKKLNITLVGFVRGNRMNIYANEHRIQMED